MSRGELDADTRLDILISATISRRQFDRDPAELIAELQEIAAGRGDILARVAGRWAGFHETDEDVAAVRSALLDIPGAGAWVQTGRDRNVPLHQAPHGPRDST